MDWSLRLYLRACEKTLPVFFLKCAGELHVFVSRRKSVQETLQNGHPDIRQTTADEITV